MTKFEKCLKDYPEYITKEDFRIVARISKQTARYLLLIGLVPCINSGKKTRCYLIHRDAVLCYLRDREENPETYRPCHSDYVKNAKKRESLKIAKVDAASYKRYLKQILKPYQDAMTMQELSAFLGYDQCTLKKLCTRGQLQAIYYGQSYRIPKTYLIDFLTSENGIPFTRYSSQYKQLIHNFYLWKLNRKSTAVNEEEQ